MRYIYCTIAIGEKYLSSAIKFSEELNKISDDHHYLIVTEDINHTIKNTTFVEMPTDKKLFIQNYFNYNLKYLPIKYSSELDYDYVIFIDADWVIGEEYKPEKVHNVLNFMDTNNYDFCFERPHPIGDGKLHDNLIFWKHKRDFYDLLNTTEFDDGHVVNEQFLIFKNNDKLKKFTSFWASLCEKSSDNNLWPFAEGVEIGMSSSHSKMTYEYYGWQKILNNCFIFNSLDGTLYKRF
jgi:hypothetical protein